MKYGIAAIATLLHRAREAKSFARRWPTSEYWKAQAEIYESVLRVVTSAPSIQTKSTFSPTTAYSTALVPEATALFDNVWSQEAVYKTVDA